MFETAEGVDVVAHESGEVLWRVTEPEDPQPHVHLEDMACCVHPSRRSELHATVVADTVVLHSRDHVELRAAADGAVRASAPHVARPLGVAAEGDRLVLYSTGPETNAVVVVDVGEALGRELWRASLDDTGDGYLDWPAGPSCFVARGLVLVRRRGVVEARRADSGEIAWEAELVQHGCVLAADELGVIVEGRGRRRMLSIEDGRTLWSSDLLDGSLCLGEDVVVARRRRADRVERVVDGMLEVAVSVSYELVAVERRTGTRRWARAAEKVTNQVTALADDVLYTVTSDEEVRLAAVSSATGKPLFETALTGLGRRPYAKIEAVPLDGALVVVAWSDNRASFARVESS